MKQFIQLFGRQPAKKLGLAAILPLVIGCAARQHEAMLGPFRQTAVEHCLETEKVVYSSSSTRSDIDQKLLAKFPGITATIDILNGTGTPPPGLSYGPPIDGGNLIFERTAAQARRDRAALYRLVHDPSINPLNPPAPAAVRSSLQSSRGNVIIIWDYPDKHPSLSMKLVERCLPGT